MLLLHRVSGYEQQLASLFDSTNDCSLSFISRRANYLISSASRVAREPPADATDCDYSFDIGKQ